MEIWCVKFSLASLNMIIESSWNYLVSQDWSLNMLPRMVLQCADPV